VVGILYNTDQVKETIPRSLRTRNQNGKEKIASTPYAAGFRLAMLGYLKREYVIDFTKKLSAHRRALRCGEAERLRWKFDAGVTCGGNDVNVLQDRRTDAHTVVKEGPYCTSGMPAVSKHLIVTGALLAAYCIHRGSGCSEDDTRSPFIRSQR
jgi:hypothetical protein